MRLIKILAAGLTAVILFFTAALSSCSGDIPGPVENKDGTVSWNGWTLARDVPLYHYPIYGASQMLKAKPHVLATGQSVLSLSFEAPNSSDYVYGISRRLQVRLDGKWYVLPFEAELPEAPIRIDNDNGSKNGWGAVQYEVDFSSLGSLPVGEYRLAEVFGVESEGYKIPGYARFWVKEPWSKAPPESLTEGKSRLEDIVLSVDSSYPTQRAITSGDDMFTLVLENLSGKTYKPIFKDDKDRGIVLERLTDGRWTQEPYSSANTHTWFMGWDRIRMAVFFRDGPQEETGLPPASLSEGRYRIRFPMKTDDGGLIEPSCEFDVLSPEGAPPPEWNMDELLLSEYEGIEQSIGVVMTPLQPILNGNGAIQEVEFTVNGQFGYGPEFGMEISLDGKWYSVPFADARGFEQPLYHIDQKNTGMTEKINLTSSFGLLPEGKYRLVREYINKDTGKDEYAAAEFTVVN